MLETTEKFFKDNELEISLSQLQTGCIPYIYEEKNYLLFKDSPQNINILSGFKKIDIRFEQIDRPEFPTISAHLFITTTKSLNIKYEYFFLTESPIELQYLKLLVDNCELNIFFIVENIEFKAKVILPRGEVEKLQSILNSLY